MKKNTFLLLCTFLSFNFAFAATYENLYIVGNACSAGWNPGGALAMTKESDGIFTWTGNLIKPDGNQERFKFLVSDSWDPSITCRLDIDGHLLIESGTEYSVYERAENASGYDNAFQVPEDGIYTIQVNLNTMKMTCTKSGDVEPETPDLTQLHLIGDATEGGWNYVKGTELTRVEDGVFIWSGYLTTEGGNEFKFLNEPGTWDKTINPVDGDVTFVAGTEYKLNFRPTEGSPKDYKFKVVKAGRYYMLVNLNTMKITIDYADPDLSELYLVGSACEAGWSAENALAMTEVEEGIFTWTGILSLDGGNEFKFLNKKGAWSKTLNPLESAVDFMTNTEYKLNFRPLESSPYDFKFKLTDAGEYTIDVNLNDMTMIVELNRSAELGNPEMNDVCYVYISNKTVNIHFKEDVLVRTAMIYDVTGRCLNSNSNIQSSFVLASNLASGIYVIKVNSGNKEFVQKIMIR